MGQSIINAFVPCRVGSQRVPGKNTRPFARWPGGLTELKLRQLASVKAVHRIVLSTDDPEVRRIAARVEKTSRIELSVLERPAHLATADALDALLTHVAEIMPDGVIAWTHVTSPFFGASQMDAAVAAYVAHVENGPFDSLMAVRPIRSFLWRENDCVSHDRRRVKWPQTQDLPRFYEVNSALFMIERVEMLRRLDRVGDRPFLFETDPIQGFDIDWPEDFELAEAIASTMLSRDPAAPAG